MTRLEVAALLGVSEKTVTRYVASGRLTAQYVRGKTGQQLDVSRAEVERLQRELQTPVEVLCGASAATAPQEFGETQTAPPVPASLSVGSEPAHATSETSALAVPAPALTLSALARIVRAVMDENTPAATAAATAAVKADVPIHNKLLLSLDEAAALSGVPRAHLDGARRQGALRARKIGRGFKIRRAELEEFVQNLWQDESD